MSGIREGILTHSRRDVADVPRVSFAAPSAGVRFRGLLSGSGPPLLSARGGGAPISDFWGAPLSP